MLRSALLLLLLSISFAGYSQETIELSNTYVPGLTEKFHVLKDNNNIKQGLYQAFYKGKTAVASGMYTQGKKTGVWHFYDINGKLIQHYNYDKKQLLFVIDEDAPRNITRFEFVPKPADIDSVSLPIRIGGILYGYLPYLTKFKVKDAGMYNPGSVYAILEILVSPYGRLAECRLLVKTKQFSVSGSQDHLIEIKENVVDSYLLNNDSLSEDEKLFAPATVNHQNVSSTIYILCNVKPNGKLSIY